MRAAVFSAPYDRKAKIITAVVCVSLVLGVCAELWLSPGLGWIAGLSLLVIAIAFVYSPRGYTVTDRAVVVRRAIGSVRVPLEYVQALRAATGDDLKGSVRLWGSGGLFGYYGLFRTGKLGRSTWFVRDRSRAVVLVTATKTALFGPGDVAEFLAAVHEQTPIGDSEYSLRAAAVPDPGWRLVPLLVLGRYVQHVVVGLVIVAIGVVSIALVTRYLEYDPGPVTYALTESALSIHDRFYPWTIGAASTDVAAIRVVDLNAEIGWRLVARTGGFANLRHQSGMFRTANGTLVRLYRARRDQRLVLIPPRGSDAPVLLDAADPDRLAEELRAEWGGR
jgi:hypothetical protein